MNKIRNMALPFICLLALLPLQSRAQGYWSGIGVKIGNNLALDYKIFVTERQALDLSIGILEPFDGIDKRGPQFVLFEAVGGEGSVAAFGEKGYAQGRGGRFLQLLDLSV